MGAGGARWPARFGADDNRSEIDLIRQGNKWSDVSAFISLFAHSYNQQRFLLSVRCFPRLILPRRPQCYPLPQLYGQQVLFLRIQYSNTHL